MISHSSSNPKTPDDLHKTSTGYAVIDHQHGSKGEKSCNKVKPEKQCGNYVHGN